jgi:hypothetical protein
MQKVRNRLLILLALLMVGTFVVRGEAHASSSPWTLWDNASSPATTPTSGEPDAPGGIKAPPPSTAHQVTPVQSPSGRGFTWAARIWADMLLRAGL